MQIFTAQMLVEIFHQVHEIKQMLFDNLLNTACQNVLGYFGSTWTAFLQHDWSALSFHLFIAVCLLVFLYRLVRNNLLAAMRSIFGIG